MVLPSLLVSPHVTEGLEGLRLAMVYGPVAAAAWRWRAIFSRPPNIAKTVCYLRLADGSGTTLVEQVRPAFGWRCRCSLFRSREARNGTSFGVEHLRDLVWSSRSSEQ
jgi:hypothetical protein